MTAKQLEKINIVPETEPPALVPVTPMQMLQQAVQSGADLDMIEKLMALQERWESGQARRAFDEAIAAAKAEIKPVIRNATGHNSKKYADFAAIATAVDPVISRHGLSYRFRTSQSDRISVTCVLSHKSGHYEETTLSGPPDTSGNKNAIQAIGSTLTYLQRYSLVQALGLAAAADDDGRASAMENYTPPPGSITQEQVDQLRDALEAKGASVKAFLAWAKQKRLEDIPAEHFESCTAAIAGYRSAAQ